MSPAGRVQTKDHNLDQNTLERVLELTDDENPVQYLLDMDTPDTALGIIAWIDDPKRLAGWRLANQEFCNPPIELITDALDKQQRALETDADLPVYHEPVHTRASESDPESVAEPEPEPVVEPVAEPEPEPETSEPSEPEPPSVHPRSRLQHGEVLVVDRGERTEYITPNDADADEPYHSRTVDDETGDVWMEDDLTESEAKRRLRLEHERTEVDKLPDPTASHATGVTA